MSYWDPNHYGDVFVWVELAMCVLAAFVLWQRYSSIIGRSIIGALALAYGAFAVFAVMVWGA